MCLNQKFDVFYYIHVSELKGSHKRMRLATDRPGSGLSNRQRALAVVLKRIFSVDRHFDML